MRRSLDVVLWEIRKHTLILQSYVADLNVTEFCADGLRKAASERRITIIGEGLVRLRDQFPNDFARIDGAPEFIRFRNRLVHMYDLMQEEEIWTRITEYLPAMLAQVEVMLAEIHPA